MDIFSCLALLMAAAFIVSAFNPQRVANPTRHRIALNLLLAFLVLYCGVPAIPELGPLVEKVTRPCGVASLFLGLRVMCSIPSKKAARVQSAAAEPADPVLSATKNAMKDERPCPEQVA
ncbi:hypothetical protein Pla123a_45100 [Posidoniimonas polymericola]|uniref:Uncharacterized protein n=1 Tax=Posidoniimonas polymericola TaxID=2528002 RepID=A0A5C5XZ99_9BACT|nr:hypothetical protein [Posidoniimonas polymericola]TWT66812.1 hypothetical protein Pla123a_45100 [Posidoniimonas polymericola]